MSQRIQFRRGTNADRRMIILNQGEPAWTTDTKEIFIGDGITSGGVPLITGYFLSGSMIKIGEYAGLNATGTSLVAIGREAFYDSNEHPFSFINSVAVGDGAGKSAKKTYRSVFIGNNAGAFASSGHQNTFVGSSAGQLSTNTTGSIYLGFSAGSVVSSSHSIIIGAGATSSFVSNRHRILYINGEGSLTPLIYGEFDNKLLKINGNLQITGALITSGNVPSSMTSPGSSGQIVVGGHFLYACTGSNLWGRVQLSSF